MVNHVDAAPHSNEAASPDEPERATTRLDEPDDWRSDFRSYLDDPE